jgi:hypothetical protein
MPGDSLAPTGALPRSAPEREPIPKAPARWTVCDHAAIRPEGMDLDRGTVAT